MMSDHVRLGKKNSEMRRAFYNSDIDFGYITWRWQFLSNPNFLKKWNLIFKTNQTKFFRVSFLVPDFLSEHHFSGDLFSKDVVSTYRKTGKLSLIFIGWGVLNKQITKIYVF